ncbi:MAG: hypothetical protein ACI865_001925 [Flavobacteriaceae bacterium]|jgi:hypothetical protein
MLRYFTAVIALTIGLGASAQKSEAPASLQVESVENENIQTSNWKSDDFDGTFQITSDDCNLSITKDFITYIKSLRDLEQDLILDLSATRSVLIIAQSRVTDPNFVPFENMVVCTAN